MKKNIHLSIIILLQSVAYMQSMEKPKLKLQTFLSRKELVALSMVEEQRSSSYSDEERFDDALLLRKHARSCLQKSASLGALPSCKPLVATKAEVRVDGAGAPYLEDKSPEDCLLSFAEMGNPDMIPVDRVTRLRTYSVTEPETDLFARAGVSIPRLSRNSQSVKRLETVVEVDSFGFALPPIKSDKK